MARGRRGRPRANQNPSPSSPLAPSGTPVPDQSATLELEIVFPKIASSAPSSPQVRISSYALLVGSDEGIDLQFVPATEINGIKCPKLEKDDVTAEVEYWQNALLCSILGANPPFDVMKGFINRIWANYEIDKVLQVRKGVFLVRFTSIQDKITVEQRGLYYFDSKPFFVKSWNPEMDLHTETITSLPLWVQLHDLDIKYWGLSSLSKICSSLGIPIKIDRCTKDKTWIRYARVLIDMPIHGPFSEHIDFINEHDMLVRQAVTYEWLPVKCKHCGMFGHEEAICKKKGRLKKEWTPVPTKDSDASKSPADQVQTNSNSFIPVTRKIATTHQHLTNAPDLVHSNSYHDGHDRIGRSDEHTQAFYTYHGVWHKPRTAKKIAMAWCILGDFNIILYKEDKLEGDAVTDQDTKELSQFMDQCELIEMRSIVHITLGLIRLYGAELTGLSSITIGTMSLISYKPNMLPLVCRITPPSSCNSLLCPNLRPASNFITCGHLTKISYLFFAQVYQFLSTMKHCLRQFNKNHFHDLKTQQEVYRQQPIDIKTTLQATPGADHLLEKEQELRKRYIEILSSSISLLKQQCKMAWIKYRDDHTRLFFAKAKQRKLATYIYTLKDDNGQIVEGFE
ncbi:hypothetical protein Cgig2_017419 [Carnegiea gigantea]|uniref:DUF4283 domain-containing protein n=1 Tax=Carnegiea gigantea TaxID=171969 RepID=A0A9Q1GSR4_9CARY|nr:hypothetical protein Cgig2_017419 [Carnegiea gigantea]